MKLDMYSALKRQKLLVFAEPKARNFRMTCEYKLVIQIVAGEVQKTVVYYICSSDNCKFIVSRELKGEKMVVQLCLNFPS